MPTTSTIIKSLGIFFLIAVGYGSCNADEPNLEGKWIEENPRETFTLHITKAEDGDLLSYCFIYDQGNRINCPSDESEKKFKLTPSADPNCYNAIVYSYYDPNVKAPISLCIDEDTLYWKLKTSDALSYLPSHIKLERSD